MSSLRAEKVALMLGFCDGRYEPIGSRLHNFHKRCGFGVAITVCIFLIVACESPRMGP